MAEFIVIPSLEFLKPYSDATKSVFGMTFSVAMNKARTLSALTAVWEDVGRSFLQPWTWGSEASRFLEVEQLRFLNPSDGTFRDWKITSQNGIEALNRALAKRFELFEELEKEQDLKPWNWGSDGTTEISKRERPWPAFVAELSLYPRPLPQALRLSFQGEVSPDFWTESLVAAPILRLKLEGGPIDLFPSLSAPATGERVTLTYTPTDPASLPIDFPILLAETMALKKGDLTSDYFDFGDLWVRGKKDDMTASPWRAGLEERLAGQLQLGTRIVDFMKHQLTKGTAESVLAKVYVDMTRKALLQLQAATVPYLESGFPGGHLLGRLAPLWRTETGAQFEAATARSLAGKAAGWFKEAGSETRLDDWILWVSPEVEGVQRSRILAAASSKGPGIASLPMQDAVAELDQLAARLFTPTALGDVFKKIWSDFLKAKGETLEVAEKELAKAFATRNPMVETNLGLQLLLSNAGRHWKNLASAFENKKADKSRGELAVKLGEALVDLGLPEAWAGERAGEMAAAVIPLSVTDASRPQSLAQQGITIQVDTIEQDQAPGSEDGDLLRHMQGVGLLMRKTGTTAWRCLNLGAACIGTRVIAEPVLLPARIAYLNDLRDPTVIYDNAPLTVRGPLSDRRVSGTNLEGEQDPNREDLDYPLVEFVHAGSEWKIPGLVFGSEYDVLPFLVTNSGAIPEELAEAEKNGWGKIDGIKGIDNEHIRKGYEYLRTVHVGGLRFRPLTAKGLPQIPAHVAPRVRELSVAEALPEGDPLRQKPDAALGALEGVPLLLLAPESFPFRTGFKLPDQFDFEVSPPTADLETWDRWVALKAAAKDRRKFVWRSFYELNLSQQGDKVPLEESGIYLDDPAVKALWAELVSLSGNTREQTKDIPLVKKVLTPDLVNWRTIPADLKSEQSHPLKVKCKVDSEGGITVTIPGAEKPLTGTGGIYRLSFYAVLENGAETRFAWKDEAVRAAPKAETSPGTSPWHLLIEVPKTWPAATREKLQHQLYEALQPEGESARKGTLAVQLDMSGLQSLRGLIYRAELQHQVWNWRGRPPADHPDVDSKGTVEAFQMSEFGERHDDEHRVLPLPRKASAQREPVFRYEENLNERGPKGDTRALFHRFSARVFSRWEGILRDEDSSLEAIEEKTQNRWQPLFVPCRHVGEVPVPKVKMVLPLTQGKSEAVSGGPGLMVVVDGPWYEVGGLAEKLAVEVMEVTGPDNQTGFLQAGTDPIVTRKSAGAALDQQDGALNVKSYTVTFDPEGAIGHHRDHSQTDPRFLASSFLLDRPKIMIGNSEKTGVNLAWWFLKLRFKRNLVAKKAVKDAQGKTVEKIVSIGGSDWSAPFWVQVLPGVERVEEDWFKGGTPKISILPKEPTKLMLDVNLPLLEHEKGYPFYLFAVMTRKVIDFAGRPDQEAYVGVWKPEDGSWTIKTERVGEDRENLFVRWVEVQSSEPQILSDGEELWDRLFKADQDDRKRMRIVRISNRFKVEQP